MKTQAIIQKCRSVGSGAFTQNSTGRIKITIRGKYATKNTSPITRGLMTIINRIFHTRERCYYAHVSLTQGAACIKGDAIIYAPSIPDGRECLQKTLESHYPSADQINIRIIGFGITQAIEMRQRYWRWVDDEK